MTKKKKKKKEKDTITPCQRRTHTLGQRLNIQQQKSKHYITPTEPPHNNTHTHTHMVKETGSKLDKKNSKVSSPKRLISLTLTVYNPIQFIIVLKDSSPITPLSPLGTCKSLSVYPCNLHTLYPYHIHV